MALSSSPKLAGSQGGPDIASLLFNRNTLGKERQDDDACCSGLQVETPNLIEAACSPSTFDLDRFGDLTAELNSTESKNAMRPFQHSGKKSLGLPFVKTVGSRLVDVDAVPRNYIALFNATFHPKPEIVAALNQLRDRMRDYTSSLPRSAPILRAVARFFLQSVEDILRKVGRSTLVEQIVQMIKQVDFRDPQTEHASLVSVHHIQNSPEAMAALAKINGKSGSSPPAPAVAGAGDGGAQNDAKKRESDGGVGDEKSSSQRHCMLDLANKFEVVDAAGGRYACPFGDKCGFRHRASRQAAGTARELLRIVSLSGSKDVLLRTRLAEAIRAATDLPK